MSFPAFAGSTFDGVMLLPPSESDVVVLPLVRKQQHPWKAAEEMIGRVATAVVKEMKREDGSVTENERRIHFFFPFFLLFYFFLIYHFF